MNTSKLMEIVEKIIDVESRHLTQSNLNKLMKSLANLAGQPQNVDVQNATSSAVSSFKDSIDGFHSEFTPQDYERVLELAYADFEPNLFESIQNSITENAMTPNVASQFVKQISQERASTFQQLNELQKSLDYFGFELMPPEEGLSEVGFQIPRDLFENDYENFISELTQIKHMIRFLSEVSTGEQHKVSVGNISTTDPLVFLFMVKEIGILFAQAVTWGIGVWFTVEQIRKIRAETAQIKAFTEGEIEDIFGKKIKETISLAVDQKVEELLKNGKAEKDRKEELKGQLAWTLNTLLAKMERGLTIEFRIEPPEVDENDEGEILNQDELDTYETVKEIQQNLVFPDRSNNPVLSLPNSLVNGDDK